MNIPTILTIIRMIAVPFIIFFIYIGQFSEIVPPYNTILIFAAGILFATAAN